MKGTLQINGVQRVFIEPKDTKKKRAEKLEEAKRLLLNLIEQTQEDKVNFDILEFKLDAKPK